MGALRTLIIAMAVIAQRYPLLSVGTDLQPLPSDVRRPPTPPQARAMQQAILALVRQGQRQGPLRSDLPPELLPQAIAGTLRITLRFARSRNAAAEDIGAQVADLLLHGFARPAEEPAR